MRVVAALAIVLLGSSEVARLREELRQAEELTERFRRTIRASFDLDEEKRRIAAVAAKAELGTVTVRESAVERTPPLEIHKVEVSGAGSYSAAHFFLYILRLGGQMDSVRFDAAEAGQVRFVARFSQPVWKGETAAETPLRDPSAELKRRLDRQRAALDVITSAVDRAMINASADALAAFTEVLEEERVALTAATVADVLTIEGLATGSSARQAVESALVKAGLEPARIRWLEEGGCRRFTIITAGAPPLGPAPEPEFVSGRDVFDAASASFCRAGDGPPLKVVAGRAADQPLFLKLRGVEAGHAFFILNDLFNENFVVDADVKGRIDLDGRADGTLDDLYAALKSAGWHVSAGPLRRVSQGKAAAPIVSKGGGPPVTLSFQDAALSDVLCLLQTLASSTLRMRDSQQRRVSVFAFEQPAGLIADALTPPRAAEAVDPCTLDDPPRPRLARITELGAAEWPVADLRVAAAAMLPSGAKAYVEVPSGFIFSVEAGTPFKDGRVKSIGLEGIVFDVGGKDVLVALR
jgi:hypothetical protein